jgi:[ribosomal protein S5]-alanine N-acetyltransferase
MVTARPHIVTERLELLAPEPRLAADVVAFFERNRAHLAPWDPPRAYGFDSEDYHRERLAVGAAAFAAGTAWRWWLRLRGDAAGLVGNLQFSQVARGPFQSAMLGYSLDAAQQGRGLMHEALQAGIAEAFSEPVRLHRLQANVRPENLRSVALLERLGFEREGLARDYLYIDGAWRDHLMMVLRNPGFTGAPSI